MTLVPPLLNICWIELNMNWLTLGSLLTQLWLTNIMAMELTRLRYEFKLHFSQWARFPAQMSIIPANKGDLLKSGSWHTRLPDSTTSGGFIAHRPFTIVSIPSFPKDTYRCSAHFIFIGTFSPFNFFFFCLLSIFCLFWYPWNGVPPFCVEINIVLLTYILW